MACAQGRLGGVDGRDMPRAGLGGVHGWHVHRAGLGGGMDTMCPGQGWKATAAEPLDSVKHLVSLSGLAI